MIHVSSSVVLLLLARGDRAWLASWRDTAGLLPILSLDRQCCRFSACAQRPSAETSASIASVSLCSPFPAKCAHLSCLFSRVQSTEFSFVIRFIVVFYSLNSQNTHGCQ